MAMLTRRRGAEEEALHGPQPQRPHANSGRPQEQRLHHLGVRRHRPIPSREVRHCKQAALRQLRVRGAREAIPHLPGVWAGPVLWPACVVQQVPRREGALPKPFPRGRAYRWLI